jgi:tRNA dimethylallyltransferase
MVEAGRIEDLQSEMRRRAPELWTVLSDSDRGNPRRLIRALEKLDAGNGPVSRSWTPDLNLQPEVAGLNTSRAILHEAIRERIRRMYEGGLMDEVRGLLLAGVPPQSTAWQAIGYSEAAAYLRGELTRAVAMERTLIRTRQLAKRQMTWFRGQLRVRWVDREMGESWEVTSARVAAVWSEIGPVRLKGLEA